MKYMHFRASCSYAGLANLLELAGVDTEDSRIALEMKLPYLFAKEGGGFVAGPMLQGAQWMDLWLRPRGFALEEQTVPKHALCSALRPGGPAMLGIKTPYGKHAVVFTGFDGVWHFRNPTAEKSGERTELALTEAALLAAADDETVVGRLRHAVPAPVGMRPLLERSAEILLENAAQIAAFSAEAHAPERYTAELDRLFRPLLLDGITMLALVGEDALAGTLQQLQDSLMRFLRGPRQAPLSQALDVDALCSAARAYAVRIRREAACTC